MSFPSRQWVLLLIPVFGIAAWLLARTIRSLLQTTRGSIVAALPSIKQQPVSFTVPGRYTLSVESRPFSSDFSRADFGLTDSTGTRVILSTVLIRTAVKSIGRVRLVLREFEIARPGPYTLLVTGLPGDQDADNRLIVGRPIGGAVVLHVLAIVVSGIFVIGSLVGTIILLVGRQGTTP